MHWAVGTYPMPEQALLSEGEVAKALGVSAKTLGRWVTDGQFPAPGLYGGRRKWTNSAVGLWLAYRNLGVGPVGSADPAPGDAES